MTKSLLLKTVAGISLIMILAGCGAGGSSVSGGTDGGTGTPVVSTSVSLAWDPVGTNEDGSTLSDLGGYKVYYGTASGSYTYSTKIGDATNCVVNDLVPGTTYYFSVVTYDTLENESTFSDELVITM